MDPEREFGCSSCWPAAAQVAWNAAGKLKPRRVLVDDSHFIVRVVACPDCGQSFLWVFTELIDWVAGDDSQAWQLVPLVPGEEEGLAELSETGLETHLLSFGENRRSLWRVHPRGDTAGLSWGLGLLPLPHD